MTNKVKKGRGAPKKATAADVQTRLDKYELETSKFDAKIINHISELRDVIFNMALGLDKEASPTNRKSSAEYLIKYVEEKYDADVIDRKNKGSNEESSSEVNDESASDSVFSLIDLEPLDDAAEG